MTPPRIRLLLFSVSLTAQAHALPSFEHIRSHHAPSDITLLDRDGAPLQTLRVDATVRRLPWVPLADYSPALRAAVVLSEDRRFVEHAGIDWSGFARSAWARVSGQGPVQGASTITMQLAGLIDDEHARPSGGRSVPGKVAQMWAASALESQWRKPQILEAYLNRVPLRGELVGVPAAAQVLFGKHPSGLDAEESAVLAALIRAPNAPATQVQQRACGVLKLQQKACDQLDPVIAQATAPRRSTLPPVINWAPHFARRWVQQQPGVRRTTIQGPLQRLAVQQLRQHLAELDGRQVQDGAVLVLDNRSGEVLAWVGSSGGLSQAAAVDAVQARRQPGSTLKPFVYALALEKRLITPASLLEDAPAALPVGSGIYAPQNYDRQHHGWVSARTALASSLNVPAVKVGAMLGPDALFARLNAFGLRLSHTGGWHGLALALGSAEVTLLDLTNAYRALANGGVWAPVAQPVAQPVSHRRVADAGAVALVQDMLADNNARALTFGLDSPLVTRGWAMVKTGTSKDLRDNWCLGATDRFTVGVWVGNADGQPMHQVSGTSGAAPIWRALVQALHDGQPSRPPAWPADVVARELIGADQVLRTEHFLAGTEPAQRQLALSREAQAGRAQRFSIRQPLEGSVYALDPDIPPQVQRIVFDGEAGQWWLNGQRLGDGPRLAWAPRPGRHRLSLRRGTQTLAEVRFEVRGAVERGATPKARAQPVSLVPSAQRSHHATQPPITP